ncbi:hypothetical protein ACIA2T_06840 [Amycolatopsis japonica]|uniref:hypothetical protein n=1 Tax=Amycolatopsis japonica TaxID=208439 RepID=UPI0037B015AD
MTVFNVLETRGTGALLRFVAAVVLFAVLQLMRIPLGLLLQVITGVMSRVDGYAVTQVSRSPRGPINHFAYTPTGREAKP